MLVGLWATSGRNRVAEKESWTVAVHQITERQIGIALNDFRVRTAILDCTIRDALSPPQTERALGFAAQDHTQVQDSNAAQGNIQEMETTSVNLFRKERQPEGCSSLRTSRPQKAKPPGHTDSIFRSICHRPAARPHGFNFSEHLSPSSH